MDLITGAGIVVVAALLVWSNSGPLLAWLKSMVPVRPDDPAPGPADDADLIGALLDIRQDLIDAKETDAASRVSDAIRILLEVEA